MQENGLYLAGDKNKIKQQQKLPRRGKTGQLAGQGRAGQGRAGQGRGRAGQGRAGQAGPGQGRTAGRAGQGRAVRAGQWQGRAGQGRAGQRDRKHLMTNRHKTANTRRL